MRSAGSSGPSSRCLSAPAAADEALLCRPFAPASLPVDEALAASFLRSLKTAAVAVAVVSAPFAKVDAVSVRPSEVNGVKCAAPLLPDASPGPALADWERSSAWFDELGEAEPGALTWMLGRLHSTARRYGRVSVELPGRPWLPPAGAGVRPTSDVSCVSHDVAHF